MVVAEAFGEFLVIQEPLLYGSQMIFRTIPTAIEWHMWDVLEVDVNFTRGNRLIGFGFNTCATFAQYVMGISGGGWLCQTLYQRLVDKKIKGVRRVRRWEQK